MADFLRLFWGVYRLISSSLSEMKAEKMDDECWPEPVGSLIKLLIAREARRGKEEKMFTTRYAGAIGKAARRELSGDPGKDRR